jgi:hypothetical protein
MHQSLQGATFHIEHVVPTSKHGSSRLENLALCCPSCNLHKSDRTQAIDPADGSRVALFNPRLMVWQDHFRWEGRHMLGLTPTGRATVVALRLNDPRRLLVRKAEELFDLFPP